VVPGERAAGFDGTTGGSDRGGRRTHIIQVLRDAKDPLSVVEVASTVGVHVNTARFHLEALVDAGLATREAEVRSAPGRRRVLYTGVLPNQTHERAQGYRLLAEILTAAIARHYPDVGDRMYAIGQEWGHYLTSRPEPFAAVDEEEMAARLTDKLDALWFAPEIRREPVPQLRLHNCPFLETARRSPEVVCQLHAGMINGSLAELRSQRRVLKLAPQVEPHLCLGDLGPAADEPTERMRLKLGPRAD